jgi:hypothetical protein
MSPTKEQRAMMAAHLCDLAAMSMRSDRGGVGLLLRAAEAVMFDGCPERDYRYGLQDQGLAGADIDAAVAAIARGEHPPDSLPGRVESAMGKAARGCNLEKMYAYEHVLYLLGAKS